MLFSISDYLVSFYLGIFCTQLTLNHCAATKTHVIYIKKTCERENVLYSIDKTIVITLLT